MKWYSIKKYKAPVQTICFLMTELNMYYMGTLGCSKDQRKWIIDYPDNDETINNVTHFLIPDPIEIEP